MWQPLDQGIIQAWKAHTKRHQIRHLVREVERTREGGKVPKSIPLQAIRWAVEAWDTDLKPSTLFNCFKKSTVKSYGFIQLRHEGDNPEPLLNVEGAEIEAIIVEVQQDMEFLQGVNHLPVGDDINLDEFPNLVEERVDDELNQIEVKNTQQLLVILYLTFILAQHLELLSPSQRGGATNLGGSR